MTRQFEETLKDIDRRCNKHGVSYTIIGGIATIIHGYTRTTGDIDISIIKLNVCTLEDLIIMKLVAARPKDFGDLQMLIPKNLKKLDMRYLRARAKEFIEVERGDVPEKLEELLRAPKTQKSRRRK